MKSLVRSALCAAALAAPAAFACVGICDNSFLLEEAYNQDPAVVQNVQTFAFQPGVDAFDYSFSQEWPLWERRNQLSYTVPVARTGGSTGLGDIQVTYRHNIIHLEEDLLIFSAKATLAIPTGNATRGLGAGSFGATAGMAVSVLPLSWLQLHSNLNITAQMDPNPAAGASFTFGQSAVWKPHEHFNALLEVLYVHPVTPMGDGGTVSPDLLISPGVRASIDLPLGIQVVPGIAVPIGVGPSAGTWSMFFYLSIENPFPADPPKKEEAKTDEAPKPEEKKPDAPAETPAPAAAPAS